MIEFLAACTVLQVEAADHGPSSVFEVRFPAGDATPLRTLDVRLNAIGYSARQNLVYGVDHHGRLVALDRAGQVVGTQTGPSLLLRHATAGVVVGERLVVRIGAALHSVDITPGSGTYGHVVRETWLSQWEGFTVDDFDLNPADGRLYGVATHVFGGGVVVAIDPATGRVTKVPGAGRLPGGRGYGAVTFSPDGSLYATNNRHDGRSTLWRVALDGSGVVTEISSRQSLRDIDSSGCLYPVADPPRPTPPPTPVPPVLTTTTAPPPPPPTTTTPTTSTTTALPVVPTRPAALPVPGAPPPPPPDEPPSNAMRIPEQRAEHETAIRNNVRDQRRWGLVAIVLILGAGALARQAAARRR